MQQFLPFLLMFVVMIVFMIVPQQRKLKKEKDFQSALKIGDKVITIGGIHGKVSEVSEATLIIETMSGKLKIDRSAVSVEKSVALKAK
ncbi:preprotein translocase subunit YajC [Flavobacterium luminosum]|uniref:Sec translocon accessory complex subunit YajC n=1 Tax=Flavobacterium luminosum TaxID=2949086 RepID=A0ABT0TMW4_9FLAO|nr:preprotein translocase subunit YajC [Flavobacterium sp. HXWNR70]MCL9808841.1 preprotein translocase subunit YajC [Flavobacterium sp. HXWNR70]